MQCATWSVAQATMRECPATSSARQPTVNRTSPTTLTRAEHTSTVSLSPFLTAFTTALRRFSAVLRLPVFKGKVGKNQTRAIRVLLTGTHEQMMVLANTGRLDDWCLANIKWLHDTFGKDNIVSCVLHMDEKTPHFHATVVPIITAPRTRRKREGEQKYKEKAPAPRLCSNELMTRGKLRQYQDTYAQAMVGFGLKRGVVASGAKHQTQQQYNRQQSLELQADIERLNAEIERLAAEKEKVEKGAKDGKNRICRGSELESCLNLKRKSLTRTDRLPDYKSN